MKEINRQICRFVYWKIEFLSFYIYIFMNFEDKRLIFLKELVDLDKKML